MIPGLSSRAVYVNGIGESSLLAMSLILIIYSCFLPPLRNNKFNLMRLGGSKGCSLVFARSSSAETGAGHTVTCNCFSISLSQNSGSAITFLKGYTKAYCVIKKLIFWVSICRNQFIMASDTSVGFGYSFTHDKHLQKPGWVSDHVRCLHALS